MIISIAATQFIFVSLGILALNVLLKSGGYAGDIAGSFPPLAVELARHGLWMFCVPLLWVAFAGLCAHVKKAPLNEGGARAVGVVLTTGLFVLYVYAGSLFF